LASGNPTAGAPVLASHPLRSPGARIRANNKKPNNKYSTEQWIDELAESSSV
jgi:hypothetical protein